MRNTPNYNLPQFDGTDKFDKDVLNDAYLKLDQAISDLQETFNNSSSGESLIIQEVINARNGKNNLKERIDEIDEQCNEIVTNDIAQITKQLDNIANYLVNVKDFGAKGDGMTDDTQAIKNAITFAESKLVDRLKGGATILFPIGTYRTTDTLTISKSGVMLKGESITTTIFHDSIDKPLFNFIGDLTIYRSGMMNFTLSTVNSNKTLIGLTKMINCMFLNLVISNSYDCFKIDTIGKVYFDNIIFTQDTVPNVSRYAFDITDASDVHFSNVQIFANATPTLPYSIVIRACDGLYFSNSHWHGCVLCLPVNNKTLASVFFDNCYFDRGDNSCFEISGSTTNPYRNFMFTNCYFRNAKRGVTLAPNSSCELIQFVGCSFTQNTQDGIVINSNISNIILNSCTLADNNTSNLATSGHVTSSANYLTLSSCQFVRGGISGYGIKSTGNYCNISNNTLTNCSGAKCVITGSANAIIDNAGYIKKSRGSATIPQGQTEILVTHNLGGISSEMIMLVARSVLTSDFKVTWVDENSFKITMNSASGTGGTIFTYWIDGNIYN